MFAIIVPTLYLSGETIELQNVSCCVYFSIKTKTPPHHCLVQYTSQIYGVSIVISNIR